MVEQIEELKALLGKATPGPWHYCGCNKCGQIRSEHDLVADATLGPWGDPYPSLRVTNPGGLNASVEATMELIEYGSVPTEVGVANAQLIAAAVNLAPALIARIEELEKQLQGRTVWKASDIKGVKNDG